MRRLAILAALLASSAAAPAPQPQPEPGTDRIRVSADGAGPSHLFWLTGDRHSDVIGVIDPLFAAIRFYRVRRAAAPGEDVAGRLSAVGVCALPVDFRPWRIHQLRRRVLIESMPDPGALGHAAPASALRTRMLAVGRHLLDAPARFEAAGAQVDSSGWDPASAVQCGTLRAGAHRVGAGTPERAVRRGNRTILLANRAGALAPAPAIAVRSAVDRLLGAHELEPAAGLRIVEAAEALPSADGVIRVRARLLAYGRDGRVRRRVAIDDSLLRGKLGLRPVVALPSGELLVMGKAPGSASPFRILSCGNIAGTLGGPCADETPVAGTAPAPPPAPPIRRNASAGATLSANRIFANVARLVSYRLRIDAGRLPESCRRAEGCAAAGEPANFVPLRGIRLTRGIFTHVGMPYAQARVPGDVDRLLAATPAQLERALATVRERPGGLPGNLGDGFEGDLGVDCSGLVQLAWGGRGAPRLDTGSLQRLESPLACSSRLPGPGWLRPGDAIGLRIDSPVHLVNHVVLFAAAMRLDGASDSWLVLESSSGCDGVCWSVRDPEWFDGWGLYRAGGRSDADCILGAAAATPIPYDLTRWTTLIAAR